MGSSWVGVKIFVNDRLAIIPPSFNEKSINIVKDSFGIETFPVNVISSELHGVMIAGNNKGILFPYQVDDEIVDQVKKAFDINVAILRSNYTALGNLILANSNFAVVYEEFSREELKQIKDVLDVEVERGKIGSLYTVGSLAVVTDKGLVLPPTVSEEEIKSLEEKFKVRADTATVNMGSQYLRLGMAANSYAALVGETSTGTELTGIERALSFLQ